MELLLKVRFIISQYNKNLQNATRTNLWTWYIPLALKIFKYHLGRSKSQSIVENISSNHQIITNFHYHCLGPSKLSLTPGHELIMFTKHINNTLLTIREFIMFNKLRYQRIFKLLSTIHQRITNSMDLAGSWFWIIWSVWFLAFFLEQHSF